MSLGTLLSSRYAMHSPSQMLQRLLVRAPQVKARCSALPEHCRVKTSPVSLPCMGRPAMVTQTQKPIEPKQRVGFDSKWKG